MNTQYTGIYSVNHIDHCHMMRVWQSNWTQLWAILISKWLKRWKFTYLSDLHGWFHMHTEDKRYNRQGLAAAKFMCLPSYNVILIHPATWCSFSFWLYKVQCSNHGGSQNVRSLMHPFFAEPWTIVNSNAGTQYYSSEFMKSLLAWLETVYNFTHNVQCNKQFTCRVSSWTIL